IRESQATLCAGMAAREPTVLDGERDGALRQSGATLDRPHGQIQRGAPGVGAERSVAGGGEFGSTITDSGRRTADSGHRRVWFAVRRPPSAVRPTHIATP